jgi:uncharacterized BrkB/YihY/UPF0761 family membrane protein
VVKKDAFDKFLVGAWLAMLVFCLASWAGIAYIVYAVLTHYHIV